MLIRGSICWQIANPYQSLPSCKPQMASSSRWEKKMLRRLNIRKLAVSRGNMQGISGIREHPPLAINSSPSWTLQKKTRYYNLPALHVWGHCSFLSVNMASGFHWPLYFIPTPSITPCQHRAESQDTTSNEDRWHDLNVVVLDQPCISSMILIYDPNSTSSVPSESTSASS